MLLMLCFYMPITAMHFIKNNGPDVLLSKIHGPIRKLT